MSVWDEEWEDYELDKHDFECWLDSINESGDPDRDEEFYNKEMEKQNPQVRTKAEGGLYQVDIEEKIKAEWVVTTPKYVMTISHN